MASRTTGTFEGCSSSTLRRKRCLRLFTPRVLDVRPVAGTALRLDLAEGEGWALQRDTRRRRQECAPPADRGYSPHYLRGTRKDRRRRPRGSPPGGTYDGALPGARPDSGVMKQDTQQPVTLHNLSSWAVHHDSPSTCAFSHELRNAPRGSSRSTRRMKSDMRS